MSSQLFKFKGTPLSDIMESGTDTFSNYNITYKKDNSAEANSRPLPTGYTSSGVDISNTAKASFSTHDEDVTSGTIPSGATRCRIICRGGGGAGGGGGGGSINYDGPDDWAGGGAGGKGGWGESKYFSASTPISGTGYKVTIGAGGSTAGTYSDGGGGAGRNTDADVKGGKGKAGGMGGTTTVKVGNTITHTAGGGGGGNGGGGATTKSAGLSGWDGYTGSTGSIPPKAYNSSTNWDNSEITALGEGGAGGGGGFASAGHSGNNEAKTGAVGVAGSSGGATIIWLYD